MDRRTLLKIAGGAGIVGLVIVLDDEDDDGPPPRKAEVFEDISIADRTMEIDLLAEPRVQHRVDEVEEAAFVASRTLVGTARAGSRSSSGSGSNGATGRGDDGYSSAPKGRHDWAIYRGRSDGSWRDENEEQWDWYDATVRTLGIGYLGSNEAYRDESPGPDPYPWNEEWSEPDPEDPLRIELPAQKGWYRVGTHLESPDGGTDFEWQAADFKLEVESNDELTVDEAWHVRPLL